MAKSKKPKEAVIPADDLIAQETFEGQALIAEGNTKVEAAMVMCRHLHEGP